jgi:hypothetical protein
VGQARKRAAGRGSENRPGFRTGAVVHRAAIPSRCTSLTMNFWMKALTPVVQEMSIELKAPEGRETMNRSSLWTVVRFVACASGLAALTASAATGKSPSSLVPLQGSADTSCSTVAQSVVFFDDRSSLVTAEAEENLFNVLRDFRKSRSTAMTLVGYAEGSGNVAHNQALSRAHAVKVWMVARGVSPAAIITELRANCPGVEEIEGAREPQNRRVEISFNEDR